jgi:hypothetical protein
MTTAILFGLAVAITGYAITGILNRRKKPATLPEGSPVPSSAIEPECQEVEVVTARRIAMQPVLDREVRGSRGAHQYIRRLTPEEFGRIANNASDPYRTGPRRSGFLSGLLGGFLD